jgi:hypothetical protein
MSDATFPQKRHDGSLTVAPRYSLSREATAQRVEDYVAGWGAGIMATRQVDILQDLVTLPRVVAGGADSVEIVFDVKPGSLRWKDWMVYLTRDLKHWIPGVRFDGFYDLVADVLHPASLSGETTES